MVYCVLLYDVFGLRVLLWRWLWRVWDCVCLFVVFVVYCVNVYRWYVCVFVWVGVCAVVCACLRDMVLYWCARVCFCLLFCVVCVCLCVLVFLISGNGVCRCLCVGVCV